MKQHSDTEPAKPTRFCGCCLCLETGEQRPITEQADANRLAQEREAAAILAATNRQDDAGQAIATQTTTNQPMTHQRTNL